MTYMKICVSMNHDGKKLTVLITGRLDNSESLKKKNLSRIFLYLNINQIIYIYENFLFNENIYIMRKYL